MGLLVNPGEVEAAGRWLVPSEEPVAPEPSYSVRVAFSCLPLPMGGLYGRVVTGCWGIGASHGDVSQMEIPGGGGTRLDIPPKEVPRVVTPLEEVVVP